MHVSADAEEAPGYVTVTPAEYAVPTENGGAPVLIASYKSLDLATGCCEVSRPGLPYDALEDVAPLSPADADEGPGYLAVSPAEYAVPTENDGAPILVAAPSHCTNRTYEIADERGVLVTVPGSVNARNTIYVPGTDRTLYEVPFGENDTGYLRVNPDEMDDQIALPNNSGVVGTAGPVAGGSLLLDVDAGPGKEEPSGSTAETML
jgi:hypothetical protein